MAGLTSVQNRTTVHLTERSRFGIREQLRRATDHLEAGTVVDVHLHDLTPVPLGFPFASGYTNEDFTWYRPELKYSFIGATGSLWRAHVQHLLSVADKLGVYK